jgi:2,3-dihydroxy-2,3-dihydro-p-cumate dehydrogenase
VKFDNRTAIVTGSASGLGLGMAVYLAEEGVRVCLADIDEARLEKVLPTIPLVESGPHLGVAADLSTREGAALMARQAIEGFGRVDILVNNAGGGVIRPTLEHTEETLRQTIDRNLWTMTYCTLEMLPHLLGNEYGRVVSIGAESVRNGLWQHAFYSAAKGGVHGFNSGLAREFAETGVTFNVDGSHPAVLGEHRVVGARSQGRAGCLHRADQRLHSHGEGRYRPRGRRGGSVPGI